MSLTLRLYYEEALYLGPTVLVVELPGIEPGAKITVSCGNVEFDYAKRRHRYACAEPGPTVSRLQHRGTMFLMVAVYRAPMRSRNDAVEPQATIERARRLGLCGFGQSVSRTAEQERLVRRVARFTEFDEGSFVWNRDTNGWFWLGRISGPYFYDADETAAAVDLVHVRPCDWLSMPMLEQDVPVAVVATFRRGGRNFQEIHHPSIDKDTQRIWDGHTNQPAAD